MSKHTPGPWDKYYSSAYPGWMYAGPNYRNKKRPHGGPYRPEDAALIAAAPEMYEALTRLVGTHWSGCDSRQNEGSPCSCGHGDSKARVAAALAKADEKK